MTRTVKRPASICATSGCGERCAPGNRHCPAHGKQRNRSRYETAEQAAYRSDSYRIARKALLAKYGTQCWACHRMPTTDNPATCHHIDGDNTNNGEANLSVLCRSCHAKLEQEVDRGEPTGPVHTRLRETLEGLGRPVDGRFFGPTGAASRPSLSHTAASFDRGGVEGG